MTETLRTTELPFAEAIGDVASFVVNGLDGKTRRVGRSLVPGAVGDSHAAVTGNPHSTTAAQVGADPSGTAVAAVAQHAAASPAHTASQISETSAHKIMTAAERNKLSWFVSVKDHGAIGNGVANDTAAITAALATGKPVFFPEGTYLTTGGHIVDDDGQMIFGEGWRTRIIHTDLSSHLFVVGNSGKTTRKVLFRDFDVWASVQKSSGAVFSCTNIDQVHWKGVRFGPFEDFGADGHRLWDGIVANGFFRCSVDRDCTTTVRNDGVVVHGGASFGGAEFEIESDFLFCGDAVVIGGNAGGVYLNGEISRCKVGIRINDDLCGTNTSNREIFMGPRSIVDSNDDYGLVVENNGAALVDIVGAWLSSSGQFDVAGQGVGLYVAPSTGVSPNIRVSGGARLYNNRVTGANITTGSASFSGVGISNNGDGITIPVGGVTDLVVSGCQFFGNVGNDIKILDPTTPRFVISGNSFRSPITNAAGISPNKKIFSNLGLVTENGGAATVASGATFVDVAHGLGMAAASHQIRITPATGWAQSVNWWVSNAGPTTFRINAFPAPGTNIVFNWEARVGEYS